MVIPANLWRMIGTSGHAVPLLDGDNTWSGTNAFSGGILGSDTRVTKTSNYTITAAQSFTQFDNLGASGTVNFTLPTAASGLKFGFQVAAAQYLKVTAGSSTTISLGPVVSASAGNIMSKTQYASVELEAISTTQWVALSTTATWIVN